MQSLVFLAAFVASISANHVAFSPYGVSPLSKWMPSTSAVDAEAADIAALKAFDAASPAAKSIFAVAPATFGAAPVSPIAALFGFPAGALAASRGVFATPATSAILAPASAAAPLTRVCAGGACMLVDAADAASIIAASASPLSRVCAGGACAVPAHAAFAPASPAALFAVPTADAAFGRACAGGACVVPAHFAPASSASVWAPLLAAAKAIDVASPANTFFAPTAAVSSPLSAAVYAKLIDAASPASVFAVPTIAGDNARAAMFASPAGVLSPSAALMSHGHHLAIAKLLAGANPAFAINPAAADADSAAIFASPAGVDAARSAIFGSPSAAPISHGHNLAIAKLLAGAAPAFAFNPAVADANNAALTVAIMEDAANQFGSHRATGYAPAATYAPAPAGAYAPAPASAYAPAGTYAPAPAGAYAPVPASAYAPAGTYAPAPAGAYNPAPVYATAPAGAYGAAPAGSYGAAPAGSYGATAPYKDLWKSLFV